MATLFEPEFHRAPSKPEAPNPVTKKGRKARNARGEVVLVRNGGSWQPPRTYLPRDVECPHCEAGPRRKCVWTCADLPQLFVLDRRTPLGGRYATFRETVKEADRRNRKGYHHDARRERAEALSAVLRLEQIGLFPHPVPPRPPLLAASRRWPEVGEADLRIERAKDVGPGV